MADEVTIGKAEQADNASASPNKLDKLVRTVVGGGVFALFVGALYEYLSLRGVQSMSLALGVLAFAGVVGVAGIVFSEWVWGKGIKHRIRFGVIASLTLLVMLWGFHTFVSEILAKQHLAEIPLSSPTPPPKTPICSGSTGPAIATGEGNIAISGNCLDISAQSGNKN